MLLPITLLISVFVGLLSVAILLASLTLLYRAFRQYKSIQDVELRTRVRVTERVTRPVTVAAGDARTSQTHTERSRDALRASSVRIPLAAGLALLLFTFSGRQLMHFAFPSGTDEPVFYSGTPKTIDGPMGTKIHVEIFGPADAPVLLFTHGWGTSNTEWYYAKRQLATQFQLILWDIPGLGSSLGPENSDYRLETMARELEAVVALAAGKPVVLVGHSIGGMINLTFCRLFPGYLGHPVSGIVQVDTSYTNPVTTTKNASINEALQKPVAEPMLRAMTHLSPLVRAMNWLSYENGTAHLMNAQSAFAGSETWGQLDLISRYGYESSPEVVARGTLGMFHWDAKPELARLDIPVLILVGQQDTTTLPSASVFMQHSIRNAQLRNVSPSAHYGLLEQNQVYNSAIAGFAELCFRSYSTQ